MFVRRKKNKSGSTSVQIIEKRSGRYSVYKTIGCSSDAQELDYLIQKAHRVIESDSQQIAIPFDKDKELEFVDSFFNSINTMSLVGPELLLGRLFDDIGFNAIEEELFRHLVITRIINPVSKLKTVDYLMRYTGKEISVYSIYRYLDKLHQAQMDLVKEISFSHTMKVLGGDIRVVFYDVTTLYFEASDEDDLRKTGFSKDGKHQHPQIVLGLLVSEGGYPLDYDIFQGNKYEGDTMMPIVEHFKTKYSLEKLVVVADSGLLSKNNVKLLEEGDYEFILGARLKNMGSTMTERILSLSLKDRELAELALDNGQRLIVGYKKNRALKDEKNRKRGLEKLEKSLASGKLTKKQINNRGYNKFLVLKGDVDIAIDYDKFHQDSKWDGLKGYITNCQLTKEDVVKQYGLLWNIERTFRISKSDLQIRPIYHRLKRRIEAHISISFAACKVYKELERQLKVKNIDISVEQAIDIIKTIYRVSIVTPYSNRKYTRLVVNNEKQKLLIEAFNLDC